MVVRVKWFYHPEETRLGKRHRDGKVKTAVCHLAFLNWNTLVVVRGTAPLYSLWSDKLNYYVVIPKKSASTSEYLKCSWK